MARTFATEKTGALYRNLLPAKNDREEGNKKRNAELSLYDYTRAEIHRWICAQDEWNSKKCFMHGYRQEPKMTFTVLNSHFMRWYNWKKKPLFLGYSDHPYSALMNDFWQRPHRDNSWQSFADLKPTTALPAPSHSAKAAGGWQFYTGVLIKTNNGNSVLKYWKKWVLILKQAGRISASILLPSILTMQM